MVRAPRSFAVPLHRQLNIYALAAGAAGIGVLVCPAPAEAEIVFTPTHTVLSRGSLDIDLNHDGVVDFTLYDGLHHTGINTQVFRLYANPVHQGSGVEGASFRSVLALNGGSPIGSNQQFSGRLMGSFCSFNGTSTVCLGGNWLDVGDRYLGLKFTVKGKTHYGWARLNLTYGLQQGITATLTGYAYETIPDKSIIAGATKGPKDGTRPQAFLDTGLTELAMLGVLALGASAGSIWRREEDVLR